MFDLRPKNKVATIWHTVQLRCNITHIHTRACAYRLTHVSRHTVPLQVSKYMFASVFVHMCVNEVLVCVLYFTAHIIWFTQTTYEKIYMCALLYLANHETTMVSNNY